MAASATVRVVFGNDTGVRAHLTAEIDARASGLNQGKTSFAPGEEAVILVYQSDNIRIDDTIVSAGSMTADGETVVEIEEDILFEEAASADLPVPMAGTALTSTTWLGRTLGDGLLVPSADRMTVSVYGSDGKLAKGVAVARVKYSATGHIYRLQSPATVAGLTDFTILVLIKGSTVVA